MTTLAVSDARAASASRTALGSFVVAQTSMGGPDLPIQVPPTTPRTIPPPGIISPRDPTPSQPPASTGALWGAIGFTADGSYSSVWKQTTQGEAEASAAKGCAKFGRGGCEVASFSGQQCAALSTFVGSHSRRRWRLSFTAGGDTYPEAQRNAMERCNSDERTRGRCTLRTAVCADGR